MFKSRIPRTGYAQFRALFWPRKGWLRPWRYIAIRIIRAKGSTHAIAAGIAAGTIGAFNPIYGIQLLTAAGVAYCIRGNVWVALLASWIGNPITYPMIWWMEWWVGQWVLLGQFPQSVVPNFSLLLSSPSWGELWDLLQPMLIGFPIVAVLWGCFMYWAALPIVHYARGIYLAKRNYKVKPL